MRCLFAALALVALPACVDTQDIPSPDYPSTVEYYAPSPPPRPARSKVMVLKDVAITQPTEILGLVDVYEQLYDHDRALESLKAKAEALGADAIVGLEYHHGGGKEPSRLSGTAIKFKDLVQGRRYEPLGTIEVKYDPGEEAQGLRELKAKARAIHADLILELKYDRGDGNDQPRVSGTAVKFARGSDQP
jgi:uncharacterized protein YbjQ (UPF0145 family)